MLRHLTTIGCTALIASLAACGAQEEADTRTGARLYSTYCASCHGAQGEGDGPVAAVMSVTVPELRTLARRNEGEFPADAVRAYVDGREVPAAHGGRRMPVWGEVFQWNAGEDSEAIAEARIEAVVDHVEQLQYR